MNSRPTEEVANKEAVKKISDGIVGRSSKRPATAVGSVLIFAYDKRPIVERKQLLVRNGYRVVICASFASALKLVQKRDSEVDFLVIGYAVPEQERLQLSEIYRDAHPTGQIIFLYTSTIKNTNPPVAALLSINGAKDNLLTAIRSVEQLPTALRNTVDSGDDPNLRKEDESNV
jgi:response regulator RpfG family c-di-GMP phosphodiesterase